MIPRLLALMIRLVELIPVPYKVAFIPVVGESSPPPGLHLFKDHFNKQSVNMANDFTAETFAHAVKCLHINLGWMLAVES